jgi:hypothetical protein
MGQNESFGLLETEMDGRRLVANIDFSLAGFPRKQDFPWFLSLSTALWEVDSEGLPTRQEADALNGWEDRVEEIVHDRTGFKFVGRVTWNGFRELLYQVSDPGSAAPALQVLIENGDTRPFAFRCQRDESWEQVAAYLSG